MIGRDILFSHFGSKVYHRLYHQPENGDFLCRRDECCPGSPEPTAAAVAGSKTYKGKRHYLGNASSKSDQAAYVRAHERWLELQLKLKVEEREISSPYQSEYDAAIEEWEDALEWLDKNEHDHEYLIIRAERALENLRRSRASGSSHPPSEEDRFFYQVERYRGVAKKLTRVLSELTEKAGLRGRTGGRVYTPTRDSFASMDGSPARLRREIWKDRFATQRRAKRQVPHARTVGGSVERYLCDQKVRFDAGNLSAGRFTALRCSSIDFRDWIGAGFETAEINAEQLSAYHNELCKRMSRKLISSATAHDRLSDVTALVRWLWEFQEIPELPRNIISRRLRIAKKISAPVYFSIEEVKKCLQFATERMRLYL